MPRLIFNPADVRRFVEHSIAAPAQGDSWGKVITEPSVILVHDQGVYLMSNGQPRDIIEGESSFIVQAKGCDPKKDADWWETSRKLVGGDDFGETLPWARELKELIDGGENPIVIDFTATSIGIMVSEKKKVDLSPGQKLMVEEGLPPTAIIPQPDRIESWKGRKLTKPKDLKVVPAKDEDPATKQLRKEVAAAEASKKAERLARLQQLKQETKMPTKKTAAKKAPAAKKAAAPKAKAPVAKKESTAKARTPVERSRYDWKGAEEKAATGTVPPVPDFSAPTHARFIPILDAIKAASKAGSVKDLKAIEISPISSTPKAMDRYRSLCVKALAAKG